MNKIKQIECYYLSANKTIETLSISSKKMSHTVYVYNYKGTSFRLFTSKQQLDGFFKNRNDEDLHFETEEALDHYLLHTAYSRHGALLRDAR